MARSRLLLLLARTVCLLGMVMGLCYLVGRFILVTRQRAAYIFLLVLRYLRISMAMVSKISLPLMRQIFSRLFRLVPLKVTDREWSGSPSQREIQMQCIPIRLLLQILMAMAN